MKTILMTLLALFTMTSIQAQTEPINVVFDLTSGDEATQKSALRHLKLMHEAYPDSQFELVVYGNALPMVLKSDSPFADKIKMFDGNEHASIKVCRGTMKRHDVSEDQLLPGVQPVTDAITEIVSKQNAGWGYIKESHN